MSPFDRRRFVECGMCDEVEGCDVREREEDARVNIVYAALSCILDSAGLLDKDREVGL